jgi:hypothetical protein
MPSRLHTPYSKARAVCAAGRLHSPRSHFGLSTHPFDQRLYAGRMRDLQQRNMHAID